MPAIEISDSELAETVFGRLSKDLTTILNRDVKVSSVQTERANERPVGKHQVHISFRLLWTEGDTEREGCLLMPLPEAISLAGFLMMVEDSVVKSTRSSEDLEVGTKEAILEVGNFIAGAVDAVAREVYPSGTSVRANCCQGVREDVRPALLYEEGSELIVARATMTIHTFTKFEAVLVLPPA